MFEEPIAAGESGGVESDRTMSHDNPMLKVPVWTTEDAAVAIDWELEHGADDDVTRLVTVPFVAR